MDIKFTITILLYNSRDLAQKEMIPSIELNQTALFDMFQIPSSPQETLDHRSIQELGCPGCLKVWSIAQSFILTFG